MDGKYLRATRPGSGSCGAAQQFDANEGDVFLVQGWIRTSVGATGELATMVVSWGDANYVPSNNNYLRRDESTQIGEPILTGQILDWTLVKMVTLPAPAGTVTARVECINDKDGNGDAYFDSIHVGRPLTAWGPNPADGAVGVRRTPRLTWRLGAAAVSHDVYFGTDFNDVADANTLDPQFINNQEPNSYQPSEILTGGLMRSMTRIHGKAMSGVLRLPPYLPPTPARMMGNQRRIDIRSLAGHREQMRIRTMYISGLISMM
jgi:hypothetical protein